MVRALLYASLLLTGGCSGSSEPECRGGWNVCGDHLRDADGRAVVMRGANLAGAHKVAPYFGFHEAADFARLRTDWGLNSIRFLMVWAAIEPEPGVYDESYLDGVALRLSWAREAGLLVVLDMHQDLYGEGFTGGDGAPRWTCDEARYAAFVPRDPWFLGAQDENVLACVDGFWTSEALQASFVAAWRRVAERFADEPAVIGIDVLNEPHWGTYAITSFEADRLQPLYERVIASVREVAPGWVAFLEPSASRNGGIATGLGVTPLPANTVYAPHSYDIMAESGEGFSEERRQALIDNAALLADEAGLLGAALWVGEYGGQADHPGIAEYMDAQYDAFGAVAAGSMYWAYDRGGGYSLLDADGNERQPLVDVIARPYPERVAGDPIGWSFDSTTTTFTFSYRADPAIAAPTEIAIPARVYPAGFAVDCGDCSFEEIAGGVRISAPPTGDPAVVTLSP
jgi:endoglycosylceramidase